MPSYSKFVAAALQAVTEAVRSDALVVWMRTTPVPTNPPPACILIPGRLESSVIAYNDAADAVVADAAGRVLSCDLHAVITDYCGVNYSTSCNITQCAGPHFTPAGFALLGAKAASCVSSR